MTGIVGSCATTLSNLRRCSSARRPSQCCRAGSAAACVRRFGGEDLDVALDQVRGLVYRAAESSRRW